jgi:hypothetical protein
MLRVVVAVLHAEDAMVGIGEGRATWPPEGEPVARLQRIENAIVPDAGFAFMLPSLPYSSPISISPSSITSIRRSGEAAFTQVLKELCARH